MTAGRSFENGCMRYGSVLALGAREARGKVGARGENGRKQRVEMGGWWGTFERGNSRFEFRACAEAKKTTVRRMGYISAQHGASEPTA